MRTHQLAASAATVAPCAALNVTLCTVLSAALAAGPPALARQDGPADAPDTIVVTGERFARPDASGATKTGTPLIETPQAISIVTADLIDALNLRTVAESLNYAAGVRAQAFGSDTRLDTYQLRGFPQANGFKDGLVQTNGNAFLSWTTPAESIGRIEVLKGPASVLYGGASAGGLVNVVTKAPTNTPVRTFEVGADEFGTVYGSADVGGALTDGLALRAVGLLRRGDTQVDLAKDDRSHAMLALGWTPRPAVEVTLRASFTRDDANRPTGFLPYEGTVTPLPDGRRIPLDLFVSDPRADVYERDQAEISYEARVRANPGVTLVSNTRYAEIDLVYAGLFGSFRGNPVIEEDGRILLSRGNSRLNARLDTLTTDNRVEARGRTGPLEHTVLVGVDYATSELASQQRFGAGPPLDVFDPDYTVPLGPLSTLPAVRQTLTQRGVYVQDQVAAGPVRAVLSVRHDRLDNEGMGRGAFAASTSEVTYRAGTVWLLGGGLAPYIGTSASFTPVLGTEDATGRAYEPETGRGIEAGLRYAPEGGRLRASALLFDIEREGVLAADPQPGFPRNRSQLGEQRSRGGEVEVWAEPAEGLTVIANLTAFEIELTEEADVLVGSTPAATPEVIASALVDYAFAEAGPLAGVGLSVGVRRTGQSFADPQNTLVVPDATVLDLGARYAFGPFGLRLDVSNALDEAYVAACAAPGTCYAANLRRATLSLRYER